MMPILLPVLVRRSVRDTTVPATRPAVAPAFTARENSAQDCTRSRLSTRGIVVERMAGEEKADRIVFALQPLGRQPRLDRAAARAARGCAAAAEQFVLPDRGGLVRALRAAEHRIDRGEGARAVGLELVEGAGGGKAFQHALVDGARIDAARRSRQDRRTAARRAPRRSLPPPARRRL